MTHGCYPNRLLDKHADKSTALGQEKPEQATAIVLRVEGEVPTPLKLTSAEFAKFPREKVHARDHDGKQAEFEGVPLVELLKAAGVSSSGRNFGVRRWRTT